MPESTARRAGRPKTASSVADRISAAGPRLTASDRKVADVVARDPQAVAFGTVADVAAHAGTSGPSVVRLAAKLGYAGFAGLQADVRAELASQLAPAVERIRRRPAAHPLEQALVAEVDNVRRTLETATPAAYEEAVVRLADPRRAVAVLAGEAAGPVGALLADQLDQLRPGVVRLSGSPVAVARQLAGLGDNAVVVAIDLRRYERWVADGASRAAAGGADVVAVTDGPLSPLAAQAVATFLVAAASPGPFDSLVGAVALVDALVAGVAARLRASAASRLESIEAAWADSGALVDDSGGP